MEASTSTSETQSVGALAAIVTLLVTLYAQLELHIGRLAGKLPDLESTRVDLVPQVEEAETTTTRAYNMVSVAIEFGVGLMVTVLMILVVGLFIANVPASGAFSGVITTATNIGGAGFVIVVVTLLVVPVVGLISYFAGSGLMAFARRGRGR